MSTLAEKLRQRKAATQSAPSTVVDVPVVVVEAPVVVEPVVETQNYVPGPIGVIPPDAPGGEKVPEKAEGVLPPERSEGLMATLAKRRSSKPAKVEPTPEPVVAPPVRVEYVVEPRPEYPALPIASLDKVEATNKSLETAWKEIMTPEKAPEVVEEPKPSSPVAAELSLFIDAYPEKAPFESLRALEDEIAARTPSLLEHLRKTSPKDVPEGTVDLGEVLFGRGYSTLSASFALRPITGAWTVSTLGPASSKVLEVLLPKATFVVRGRR